LKDKVFQIYMYLGNFCKKYKTQFLTSVIFKNKAG
jgi:hypothetical protein